MVPGVGVEPLGRIDTTQLVDSTKRQNGEKLQRRRTEVHAGYTEFNRNRIAALPPWNLPLNQLRTHLPHSAKQPARPDGLPLTLAELLKPARFKRYAETSPQSTTLQTSSEEVFHLAREMYMSHHRTQGAQSSRLAKAQFQVAKRAVC